MIREAIRQPYAGHICDSDNSKTAEFDSRYMRRTGIYCKDGCT